TRFSRDWSSDVCSSDLTSMVSILTSSPFSDSLVPPISQLGNLSLEYFHIESPSHPAQTTARLGFAQQSDSSTTYSSLMERSITRDRKSPRLNSSHVKIS